MKQYSVSMDDDANLALDLVAEKLSLSRSAVILRLVILADAVIREEVGDAPVGEVGRVLAERACEKRGLVTLGPRWNTAEGARALLPASGE